MWRSRSIKKKNKTALPREIGKVMILVVLRHGVKTKVCNPDLMGN